MNKYKWVSYTLVNILVICIFSSRTLNGADFPKKTQSDKSVHVSEGQWVFDPMGWFCDYLLRIAKDVDSCQSYKAPTLDIFSSRDPLMNIIAASASLCIMARAPSHMALTDTLAKQHPDWMGLSCNLYRIGGARNDHCVPANTYIEPRFPMRGHNADIAIVSTMNWRRSRGNDVQLVKFAKKYNYDLFVYDENVSPRTEGWDRLFGVAHNLPSYKWVVSVRDSFDIDRLEASLADIINKTAASFIATPSEQCSEIGTDTLSSDFYIVKNVNWAHNFLKDVWNKGAFYCENTDPENENSCISEQEIMNGFFFQNSDDGEHLQILTREANQNRGLTQ